MRNNEAMKVNAKSSRDTGLSGPVSVFRGSEEDIVEALYAGAAGRAQLKLALAQAIAFVGAGGGNIHVVSKASLESVLFATAGPSYTPDTIAGYFRHWRHINIYRPAMRRDSGVFLCHEHLTPEALARSPYAQDFYFAMGERWLAGAVAQRDPDFEVSLVFNRREGQPQFGETERRFITDFMPHVRRAAVMAARSEMQNATADAVVLGLSALKRPVWLVDGELRVVWQNDVADALAPQARWFSQSRGRLVVADAAAHGELLLLVKSALARRLEGAGAKAMRVHDEEGAALEIEVMPATAPDGPGGARSVAMVLGRPIGLCAPSAIEALRARHALSPKEAELAIDIARGLDIEAIAEGRKVSPETVRTQLRSIYAKTGTGRQAELAALVWQSGG